MCVYMIEANDSILDYFSFHKLVIIYQNWK